jgi:hypothetical protein
MCPTDTLGVAKKPGPPKLFWLTYHHPDGAGVILEPACDARIA